MESTVPETRWNASSETAQTAIGAESAPVEADHQEAGSQVVDAGSAETVENGLMTHSGHHHRRGLTVLLPSLHHGRGHDHSHSHHGSGQVDGHSHGRDQARQGTDTGSASPLGVDRCDVDLASAAVIPEFSAATSATPAAADSAPFDPASAAHPAVSAPAELSESSGSSDQSDTTPRIVFVGNPNVGKSTLFNRLLGTNAAVMNAPGTTVLIEQGEMTYQPTGQTWQFIDTPGTASLGAISPDELVAAQTAVGWGSHPDPDVIVAILDSTSLSRSLYLLSQLVDSGTPLVVGLTMTDLAAKQGVHIDLDRLSASLGGLPVVAVDGRTGQGCDQLLAAVASQLSQPIQPDQPIVEGLPSGDFFAQTGWQGVEDWIHASSQARFDWVARELKLIDSEGTSAVVKLTVSDQFDRFLLHPVVGILIFLAVMFAVFEATTTLAGPLIDWFDVQVRGWLTAGIDWAFLHVAGPASLGNWLHSLLIDGLLQGLITVLTFVPPMAIMFIILSLLEDSGYLARAAFVMDKAMRLIGLDGRAFLPLVVGFGCNLPALAATRTLPDSRQRLMTGLLIPFTSCSARLSVYVVLAYAFFAQYAGLAIFLMYVLSILVILLVGLILRRTQFRDLTRQPFAMGLPSYQFPKLLQLGKSVGVRLWGFISGASSIIITMIVLMWVLASIPVAAGTQGTNSFAHIDSVQHSVYGAISSAVAPVFRPAGFDDWHASAALITGFVAKEVVVGSMSQSFASSQQASSSAPTANPDETLGAALRASFTRSSGGHAQAAAAAFMVFVLAYTPCLATVAEMKRQFGLKTALQSVSTGLVIAYILAIVVFQLGVLL